MRTLAVMVVALMGCYGRASPEACHAKHVRDGKGGPGAYDRCMAQYERRQHRGRDPEADAMLAEVRAEQRASETRQRESRTRQDLLMAEMVARQEEAGREAERHRLAAEQIRLDTQLRVDRMRAEFECKRRNGKSCSSSAVSAPTTTVAASAFGPEKLMLFGGKKHDVYLGCLSCDEYATDSVHSKYSSFGNEYGTATIFSAYGDYGSAYSDYSVCNPYATDPPIIVDERGNAYGRLTINQTHEHRSQDEKLNAWIVGVCESR